MILLLLFLLFFLMTSPYTIQKKPPMGWNSWTAFGTDINETLVHETVEALISKGLQQYEYIIIDDGWVSDTRDENGDLVEDHVKFPSGMKALGDYIHSKGFKFGLYTSIGKYTCEGYPGSYGYERQDAQRFAEWGVDYVKIDWCTGKHIWWPFWNYKEHYELMCSELRKYPIVIALCNWGFGDSIYWGISDTVRITFDVKPNDFVIDYIIHRGRELYGKGSSWNDLDSLQIGNGISRETALKQMYWWCVLKSPLILGADVRSLTQDDIDILTNPELIAYNQETKT